MKLKLTLISLLIIIFAASCGEKKLEGYQTYQNESTGFSIMYPDDWSFREGFGKDNENMAGAVVVFQSPNEGKADPFRENSYIFIEDLPDSINSAADYLAYSKSSLPNQLQAFEVLEEGLTLIDNEKTHWVIFNYTNRMQKVQSLAYLFYRNNGGFVFTSTARPETMMKYRRTFENMATSIKFDK